MLRLRRANTGGGDPDLYVRHGAMPDLAVFDERRVTRMDGAALWAIGTRMDGAARWARGKRMEGAEVEQKQKEHDDDEKQKEKERREQEK